MKQFNIHDVKFFSMSKIKKGKGLRGDTFYYRTLNVITENGDDLLISLYADGDFKKVKPVIEPSLDTLMSAKKEQ